MILCLLSLFIKMFLLFHVVSQMVIEEVNVLQTQLEIEKSCRENAEALATKVKQPPFTPSSA